MGLRDKYGELTFLLHFVLFFPEIITPCQCVVSYRNLPQDGSRAQAKTLFSSSPPSLLFARRGPPKSWLLGSTGQCSVSLLHKHMAKPKSFRMNIIITVQQLSLKVTLGMCLLAAALTMQYVFVLFLLASQLCLSPFWSYYSCSLYRTNRF